MAPPVQPLKVRTPPEQPVLVYDGDCRFCVCWIHRWRRLLGDSVRLLASQDPLMAQRFPEIPRQRFEESVQFIAPDGCVHSGADAVLRALEVNWRYRWLRRVYVRCALCAACLEGMYAFTARHRRILSVLTLCLRPR